MERFVQRKSLAGVLQPGDGTRYEMVVFEDWDAYYVIVTNLGDRPDMLTFLRRDYSFYKSAQGEATNPWTIKAAREMIDRLLGTWREKEL